MYAAVIVGLAFGIPLSIFILIWLINAIRNRLAYEAYMAVGYGLFLSMFFFRWHPIEAPDWLGYVGVALLVLSGLLFASTVAIMRRAGRPTDAWEKTTVLVVEGPFRIVRHPAYLSAIVATIGAALAFPSWSAIVCGAVGIVLFVATACDEDPRTAEKFGEAYKQYRRTTPMLNPLAHLWLPARAQEEE
jgi:protein-S-isoprenylcysteine O-methyltransferase Ste14